MTAPDPPRLLAACGLAVLAALAFTAPAFATEVTIDEGTEASELEVSDPDDDRDVVTVSIVGPNILITDTGPGGITPDGTDCTAVNAAAVTCPLDPPDPAPPADPYGPIDEVDFEGNGGNDDFTLNALLDGDDLEGGPGNDVLIGNALSDSLEGEEGTDQLFGNGGGDDLFGGEGNDALDGGEGNDFFEDGGEGEDPGGTDTLTGGPGFDEADYFRDLAVNVSLDDVANDGLPGENDNLIGIEAAEGGLGDDTLVGNDLANELESNEGNDTIRGLGGNDEIASGDGDDLVVGGKGPDAIFCGIGFDTAPVDPGDEVDLDCEQVGASVAAFDTAKLKKGTAKVPVSCAANAVATCEGTVKLLLNGKSIGKGKFKVAPGKTKKSKVKLSKKGAKALKRFGGEALGTAQVSTKLAGETSVSESDILIG